MAPAGKRCRRCGSELHDDGMYCKQWQPSEPDLRLLGIINKGHASPNYTPLPSPAGSIEYGDAGLESLWRWLRGKPSLRTGRLPRWKR